MARDGELRITSVGEEIHPESWLVEFSSSALKRYVFRMYV